MTTAIRSDRVLRPLRHLPWRLTAAGNIVLVAPGAAVAIALSVLDGRPVMAAVVAVVLLAYGAVVIVPALKIRLRLDEDGLTTIWSQHPGEYRIERSSITRAVIRTIYNGDGISTNRHLFLLDGTEHAVHRMSSRWWTDEQLLAVAHHLRVPLDSQPQPVHLAEVRRTAPQHLRWIERHRVLAGAAMVGIGFVLCLGYAALLTAAS